MILHWHPGIRNSEDFLITIDLKKERIGKCQETTKQRKNETTPQKVHPLMSLSFHDFLGCSGLSLQFHQTIDLAAKKKHTDDTVDGQILQTPRKGLD